MNETSRKSGSPAAKTNTTRAVDTGTADAFARAADEPPIEGDEHEPVRRTLLRQLRPAIVMTLLLTLILGVAYPLATTGVAQLLFPSQANGSLVSVNGKPVASSLIGQYWTQPR